MSMANTFYADLKRLVDRGRVVHAAYSSSVLVEFKEPRDAATLAQWLQDLKDKAKAERKAEMLAHGAGG